MFLFLFFKINLRELNNFYFFFQVMGDSYSLRKKNSFSKQFKVAKTPYLQSKKLLQKMLSLSLSRHFFYSLSISLSLSLSSFLLLSLSLSLSLSLFVSSSTFLAFFSLLFYLSFLYLAPSLLICMFVSFLSSFNLFPSLIVLKCSFVYL